MFKHPKSKPVLFKRTLTSIGVGLLTIVAALYGGFVFYPNKVAADTNDAVNFQARLQSAAGAVVPDGYYNVQFKLYSAPTGGSALWTETYYDVNGAGPGQDNRVQVINGYVSVNLGSTTAFPGTINWDQQLYLTMNIGGTNQVTPSWDGEMSPRLKLTGVPYAFRAGGLASYDHNTGFTSTLNMAPTIGGNQEFVIPDQGAGGTYNLLTENQANTFFIQNNTSPQTADFNITGTGTAGLLQAGGLDTAGAGTLTIGGTNATAINLAQNVTVAAGKSLTLAGGNTASRPVSPTEGTLYYDTDTKQLLVYANGKWQADRSTASKIVGTSASGGASSAAASLNPDGADFVNTSTTSAQTTINSALSALSSSGGSVYLMEGTYVIDDSISIPNNVTLIGSGSGTVIKLKNSINANINAIVATDTTTGTGVRVSNLRIDGNKANNSSGTQSGVYFNNMGGGNGASARQGAKLTDLWITDLRNYGIMLQNSNNGIISDNNINNSNMGIYFKDAYYITLTSNIFQGNSRGIYAEPMYRSTISGNTFESNGAYGAFFAGTSSANTFTGNTVTNNATAGVLLADTSDSTVSGNRFRNNGGTTTNQGIVVDLNSDRNSITGNNISDDSCTTTCYAINIASGSSDVNYLADNAIGSNGAINDAGTGTIYANQLDANGKLINKSVDGMRVQTGTNSASAFDVQNAAGTSALTVNTTNNSVLVAGTLDTTTGTTLSLGATSATAIVLGNAGITTTVQGNFRANNLDTASATTLDIGTTNATSINLNQNVVVAAGKSLTIAGGNTASRPASPTEGMLYFDTTTKQLLVYANGKWQANGKSASKVVAASDSPQAIKDAADYVADGTGDQTEINAALIAAAGGKVYLAEGTYTISAAISVPNNTTLAGAGAGTVITIPNSHNANINAITNTTGSGNGTNITIQDLKLDGNRDNQASGSMHGIYLNGVGSGSGNSAVKGALIRNVQAQHWKGHGIDLASGSNNTLSQNTAQDNESNNITLASTTYTTISDNMIRGGYVGVYLSSSDYAIIANNTIEGTSADAVAISSSTDVAITDNVISGNMNGIFLNVTTTAVLTGNMIVGNTQFGIGVSYSSGSTISGNTFVNNGGTSANDAIYLSSSSSNNTVTSNTITDSSATTTNYSINITNSSSNTNYLADNTLGGGSINDQGTGTIYANQLDENGKLINKSSAGTRVQTGTDSTSAFQVQNAAGTSALTVDTTNNAVLVAGALDTTGSASLTVGGTNATSITIGKSGSNITTTFQGVQIFKPTTGNDSATAFQIQNASGTTLFNVNTSTSVITIGGASNNIAFSSTGQFTLNGTARRSKTIQLKAEYANSVLDAGSGSNNNGTMTSGLDLTNRMNYYKWTTSQGSNQDYDIVVQVPVPDDFDAWASNPLAVTAYTSNTTNGTIKLEARDTGGTVRCNFVSVTPGSTTTWATNNSACTLSSGTYAAGDYMTLRIRLQSPNAGDVRVGNVTLSYLSKY